MEREFRQAAALGRGARWRGTEQNRNVLRGGAKKGFLGCAEDFAGEGEEGAGFVVPLDDAFQTPSGFLGLVLGHMLEQGFDVPEALARRGGN